jgi:predicted Fe-Mo cluster-binding NifX family protein
MGVSRTTFSRIIKNARTKIAIALINGKALYIEDEKDEYSVAFICDDLEEFGSLSIHSSYIIFVKLYEKKILSVKSMSNPLQDSSLKPANILPQILAEKSVNYFITDTIGEGLKSSLLTKGIFVIEKDSINRHEVARELF